MVETRSGKMQDPAQERIQAEESAKPQPGATIGRDASSDPVVLNPNIDIPKYDGTEDPRPWIESLEEIGFLYHWADYIISRYAAMNMTGSAKTWLNLHKASFTSWENIKIRLIQDFSLDANKEELRMKLNRMQHWNEPAIRPQQQSRYVPPTAARNYQTTSRPQAPVSNNYKNDSPPTPRQYRNNFPQPSTPRRPYNPNFVPKPNLQRNTYNKSQEVSKNRTEDGRPICFKCNKPGHVARYCRVKFIRILEEDPADTQEKVEEKCQMNEISEKSGPRLYADSAKNSIVPECSMKLIKALVETEDGEYISEESSKMFQTNGLRLARSLINVINRETHIWITNPYPRPLKIMKNQTLAFGSSPAKINVSREREVEKNEEPRSQINENLSPKEQKELKQVLERYGDLFSSRLGRTNLAKHRIDTEDAKPIKHKPYRVSAKERDIIKEQIDEMLTEGIIRPSSSPWSFPVILVKKRDGKYRFCVDYRKLNNVTVKDVYPIPRIDEVMDTLQGSTHFSAIDLRSGYWQVEVEERDKEKTAFTTAHGLYEFNVMPFGLCNAPATFERNMENMLGNLRWQICLCYLDDVIIYSPDFPTHLKRLEAVFRCFREYNLRHFKIVTDHHTLCWLKNLKDPTGRLARWALKIQEYDFDIIHKSGKKHLDADGLSRGPLPETDWDEDFERLFLNQITDEEDKFIESVKKNLNGSRRSIAQNFKVEDGCLFKKNPNPEGRAWLLVVPEKKKREIMKEYHNHISNGHLGVDRTMYRIKSKYFWPSMLKDVSEFVKTCHLCQSRKGSNQLPSGLLQPIPPANFPFERIGIDFVGPLPSTKNRKKWIIVLTDYYTRYAETKAVSEATVKEVSKFLVEDIFLRHGAPQYLISDRGSQFTSNLMKEVMKTCKIKHCFTTSYHPQTNGLTERLNRTLINMLSMYVNTDQKNWDEILPVITHAYNTTIQETTGYSPFFLMFGREPTSLLDDRNMSVDIDKDDYDEYIKHHLDKINRTRKLVINNTIKTQERMKKNYDKKHMEKSYEPGELVAVWTPIRKIGKCEKLMRKYFGPYRILKKLSNVNYLIEPKDNPGQDPLSVHVSRIKPYFERIDENFGHHVTQKDQLAENLKTRAQGKEETSDSYIQDVLHLCREVDPAMMENEIIAHLKKGISEEIYQSVIILDIATIDEFIKWCRKIEASNKKRVNKRVVFDRLPNVAAIGSADSESMEDLVRRIVREEVHRALNPESTTPELSSLKEIIREEIEKNVAVISKPIQRPPPRQSCPNQTRTFNQVPRRQYPTQTPIYNQTPPQRRTDEWRTHDNIPICFNCGRSGHVKRYCRERRQWTQRPEGHAPSTQKPKMGNPQAIRSQTYRRQSPKKLSVASSFEGEAAGVKNPPSSTAAKLQQNYVEIIIDDIAFSALVDSGSSFLVISDGLRRQLKKTMFKDSGMTLKVADGKNLTSIGRCTISLSINGLEQPLEFIVLPNSNPSKNINNCNHNSSIFLGLYFLKASNAVIDCGRAEIRLEEAKDVLNSPASMGKVVTSRSVVIPAESTKLINVMSEELNGQNQVLFEPSKKVSIGKGLTLPCALFRLSHNKGKLWIVNSGTTAQIVPKGMCLGRIQRVEENNLTAISEFSEFNKEVKDVNHASHADKSDFKFLQNLISDDLSEEQQSQILSILKRHDKIFDKNNEPVKQTSVTKHKIETGIHQPIRHRPYRVSPTERQAIQTEVDKMLDAGIIRHSESSWSSLVILVKKKDDDIVVYSKSFNKHLHRLEIILQCLDKPELRLNPKKCLFGTKRIRVFGHLFDSKGIYPDPEKIEAIARFPTPKSITDVRSFIGLCSYYRRFIENFAEKAAPLHEVLKKDNKFTWNSDQQDAFDSLKKALMSEPVLAYFEEQLPTELHTDASGYGIGAVLVQINDGKERPVGYASRTLSKAEKNYSTTERECLAAIWAINKFRPYLFGQCQRKKQSTQKPPGLLKAIPPATSPFQRVGMDLLGRFPKSDTGNKWIIVCTDYLTRFAVTKALPTGEAKEAAKFLMEDVVLKHGAPREIITDRGRVFQSKLIAELTNQCSSIHRFTTAYHPQTNGLTERLNKTLANMIA
ncbi:hypothetical protein LAZ67_22000913, partial [Cordylochernes scorpioides]